MSGTSGRARFTAVPPRFGAAAIAALMLAVSGCGGSEGDVAVDVESTYSEAVPAAAAPGPEGFTSVEVQGVQINAPEDWAVDTSGGRLCMRPPGQDACAYGALQVIPKVAEKDPRNWPKKDNAFNKPDGWASAPDTCRSLNTADSGEVGIANAVQEDVGGDRTTKHADGLKSHHRVWTVTCENDDTFEVRLWFLPKSDVAVYAWSVDTRYAAVYDQIAASMDTTDYKRE